MDLVSRETLDTITGLMRAHAAWGAPILFGIMVLEGIILTTFLFSGSLMILAAGALIQAGVLAPAPCVVAIVAGFWLGDWINFEMGRRSETWLRTFGVVRRNAALLDRAEAFLKRWDKAAIFLSRFMGPLRPFVVYLAGPAGVPTRTFHLMTLLSTLLLTAGLLNAGMTGVQLFERWR
jgi:membrane protein DedA with SNARE-associated domain